MPGAVILGVTMMVQLHRGQVFRFLQRGQGLTPAVLCLTEDVLCGIRCNLEIAGELVGVYAVEVVEGVVACGEEGMLEEAGEGEGCDGDHGGGRRGQADE